MSRIWELWATASRTCTCNKYPYHLARTNTFVIGLRSAEVKEQQKKEPDRPSGLKFEEWDQTENVDSSQMLVAMMINSSELRAAGFMLRKVFPRELESASRRRSTRSAGIRQFEGMGPKRFQFYIING